MAADMSGLWRTLRYAHRNTAMPATGTGTAAPPRAFYRHKRLGDPVRPVRRPVGHDGRGAAHLVAAPRPFRC